MFGSEDYANIYTGSSSFDKRFDRYKLAKEFLNLVSLHPVGFSQATIGWDVSSVQVVLSEDDDELEEQLEDIQSLGSELQYEVLGSSEDYSYRVFESYEAYDIPEEIPQIDLEP